MLRATFSEGSVLSRIAITVTSAVIIAMIFFGMKLYAGQQDRYTASDARQDKEAMYFYLEEYFTRKDVNAIQFQQIKEQLDRIERKMDAHLDPSAHAGDGP